jgi:hypothetical protein
VATGVVQEARIRRRSPPTVVVARQKEIVEAIFAVFVCGYGSIDKAIPC